jgi:hypothetical protein
LSQESPQSRRRLLKKLVALAPFVAWRLEAGHAADLPLISEDDPVAKAVKYVDNVSRAKGAAPGNTCANCSLYQGAGGSPQGPCQIFPGKLVKAAGWCASWAAQI